MMKTVLKYLIAALLLGAVAVALLQAAMPRGPGP